VITVVLMVWRAESLRAIKPPPAQVGKTNSQT